MRFIMVMIDIYFTGSVDLFSAGTYRHRVLQFATLDLRSDAKRHYEIMVMMTVIIAKR